MCLASLVRIVASGESIAFVMSIVLIIRAAFPAIPDKGTSDCPIALNIPKPPGNGQRVSIALICSV
jgi:hypothetical protein